MQLKPYTQAILQNIESRSLLRYDPTDVDTYLVEKRSNRENSLLRKGFRLLDILAPVSIRRMMSLPKQLHITALYHVGMALLSQPVPPGIQTSLTARFLAETAIGEFYDGSAHLWRYAHPHFSPMPADSTGVEKAVTMPMHGLARINIFLLALWRAQGDEQFLRIAADSMEGVLRQHNVRRYADGSASISYFYNSNENVLNVNSEFLQWLADIPAEHRPAEAVPLGHSILKMLLQEQNEDGSFYYYSKENMAVRHIPKSIDNHHTSYVLSNLVHVLDSDFPTAEEKSSLILACQHGMEFSLRHLFDEATGIAEFMIGTPRRKADAVTYSEAIVAMCAFLRSPHIADELKERLHIMLPKAMGHLLELISLRDGSAPSEIVFGIATRMDSIRWGNGPALQAIFDYYSTTGEGF